MNLEDFLESLKNDKNAELFNEQMKTISIPSSIHKKIKQTAFLYNIPQSNLVGGILNQWIENHRETIINDRIKSIENDF